VTPADGDADGEAGGEVIALEWSACDDPPAAGMPGGLEVAAFHLGGERAMERSDGRLRWRWSRDA
jgi:hypothetical protein